MSSPLYLWKDGPVGSRRTFLRAATSSLAVAAWWSTQSFGAVTRAPRFSADPFSLGVASGDPADDGFVLWTRLAPDPISGGGMDPQPVAVDWVVAEDEVLSRVVRRGTAVAQSDWAHSVHVELRGLKPDRWYWYEFRAGGAVSPRGRTRTMPAARSLPNRLRFAFASCQHYETGLYTAYQHMAAEDLDLVIHLGDYIYEGAAADNRTRRHNSAEIVTLNDYRNRYALYRTDVDLQRMHAQAPWLVTWDDHEVDNNYAADISEEANVDRSTLLRRRAAAYQAYYEHMPLRRASLPKGPDMKLFRRVSFGRLADLHVLDTRQYRTDQPCGDGNKPPCPESMNPAGTLLGDRQRRWLFRGLDRSQATWNVLAQQVMMARVDRAAGENVTFSMDQWPGYEYERREILRHFRDRRVANPVVLTGDIHTNWANELLADFDRPDSAVVGTEFVGTSISSGGDGQAQPTQRDSLLAENPFVKHFGAQRGYVSCTVTPAGWQTDYRSLDFVTRPGSPVRTEASFLVEAGRPGLQRA